MIARVRLPPPLRQFWYVFLEHIYKVAREEGSLSCTLNKNEEDSTADAERNKRERERERRRSMDQNDGVVFMPIFFFIPFFSVFTFELVWMIIWKNYFLLVIPKLFINATKLFVHKGYYFGYFWLLLLLLLFGIWTKMPMVDFQLIMLLDLWKIVYSAYFYWS